VSDERPGLNVDADAMVALRKKVAETCHGHRLVDVFGVLFDMSCRAGMEIGIDARLPWMTTDRLEQLRIEKMNREAGIANPSPEDQGSGS
jgi:hypothetical protein